MSILLTEDEYSKMFTGDIIEYETIPATFPTEKKKDDMNKYLQSDEYGLFMNQLNQTPADMTKLLDLLFPKKGKTRRFVKNFIGLPVISDTQRARSLPEDSPERSAIAEKYVNIKGNQRIVLGMGYDKPGKQNVKDGITNQKGTEQQMAIVTSLSDGQIHSNASEMTSQDTDDASIIEQQKAIDTSLSNGHSAPAMIPRDTDDSRIQAHTGQRGNKRPRVENYDDGRNVDADEDDLAYLLRRFASLTDEQKLDFTNRQKELNPPPAPVVSDLHQAVNDGNVVEVQRLVNEEGVNVDAVDNDGNTPLACIFLLEPATIMEGEPTGTNTSTNDPKLKKNYEDMIKFFIDCGADVNAKNNSGDTPSHHACRANGFFFALKLLIEHAPREGARRVAVNLNLPNPYGWTAFHVAVFRNRLDIVKYLLLVDTHSTEAPSALPTILELNLPDKQGRSALHLAVGENHLGMVGLLVDRGVQFGLNVNQENNSGMTPHAVAKNMTCKEKNEKDKNMKVRQKLIF